jgi:hypothetical protein
MDAFRRDAKKMARRGYCVHHTTESRDMLGFQVVQATYLKPK